MRSALKYRSAISPMMNGAMMAPHDCVENASAVWAPLAWKLAPRKVPSVTNQQPQMKNCRNIITLSRAEIAYIGATSESGTISLATHSLHRDALRLQNLVLQCVHRGGGFIDGLHEGQ